MMKYLILSLLLLTECNKKPTYVYVISIHEHAVTCKNVVARASGFILSGCTTDAFGVEEAVPDIWGAANFFKVEAQ